MHYNKHICYLLFSSLVISISSCPKHRKILSGIIRRMPPILKLNLLRGFGLRQGVVAIAMSDLELSDSSSSSLITGFLFSLTQAHWDMVWNGI